MPDAWLERLTTIAAHHLLALNSGCSDADIERAETELGVAMPPQLADFLRATNGLSDLASRYEYGWSIDTIVAENCRSWADRALPFSHDLLAFGADGAGGWFCLSLACQDDRRVFHWTWIEGSADPIADDLAAFWPSWLSGRLTV
jgi:cell wall assembly regulator SMI1